MTDWCNTTWTTDGYTHLCNQVDGHDGSHRNSFGDQYAPARREPRGMVTPPTPVDDLVGRILDGQLVVREIPVGHTTPGGAIIAYDYQITFDPSLSRNYQATVEAEQVADNNDDPRPY